MPTPVEIRVYVISHTMPNYEGMDAWLKDIAPKYPAQTAFIGCPDTERVIGAAARRCYMSFEVSGNKNLTQVRSNWADFFENILKSGHGSVLEHSTVSFAIEGCSRVFTAEMNRHRAGVAISEGSMRFIRYDDMSYWIPTSLQDNFDVDSGATQEKKRSSRQVLHTAFKNAEWAYRELCQIWDIDSLPFNEKKRLTSMFRRVAPMGVASGGVWTLNLRALRHIIAMRTSEAAEEEIHLVAMKMAKFVAELLSFKDFEEVDGICMPQYAKV